jgi:hypothetical protein
MTLDYDPATDPALRELEKHAGLVRDKAETVTRASRVMHTRYSTEALLRASTDVTAFWVGETRECGICITAGALSETVRYGVDGAETVLNTFLELASTVENFETDAMKMLLRVSGWPVSIMFSRVPGRLTPEAFDTLLGDQFSRDQYLRRNVTRKATGFDAAQRNLGLVLIATGWEGTLDSLLETIRTLAPDCS